MGVKLTLQFYIDGRNYSLNSNFLINRVGRRCVLLVRPFTPETDELNPMTVSFCEAMCEAAIVRRWYNALTSLSRSACHSSIGTAFITCQLVVVVGYPSVARRRLLTASVSTLNTSYRHISRHLVLLLLFLRHRSS